MHNDIRYNALKCFLGENNTEGAVDYLGGLIREWGTADVVNYVVTLQGKETDTLLGLCVRWASLRSCLLLLKHGADPLYQRENQYFPSPLGEAAGYVEEVLNALDDGCLASPKEKLCAARVEIFMVLFLNAECQRNLPGRPALNESKEVRQREKDFGYAQKIWNDLPSELIIKIRVMVHSNTSKIELETIDEESLEASKHEEGRSSRSSSGASHAYSLVVGGGEIHPADAQEGRLSPVMAPANLLSPSTSSTSVWDNMKKWFSCSPFESSSDGSSSPYRDDAKLD